MKINLNAGVFGNDGSPFGAGNPFGGSTFGGGGPFGFDFGNQAGGEEYQSQPSREPREAKSIKSPVKRTLVNLLTTLIIGAVYFYIVLPPINLKAPEFYSFVFLHKKPPLENLSYYFMFSKRIFLIHYFVFSNLFIS